MADKIDPHTIFSHWKQMMPPEELILAYSLYSSGDVVRANDLLAKYGLPPAVLAEMKYVHVWSVHSYLADPANCDIHKPPEQWNVAAVIPVRGGSRGIPRKALASLAGRPLLEHAIEKCRRSRYIKRVIVSTDDEEIADAARRAGAETPYLRPRELSSDRATLKDVLRFALYWLEVQEHYFHDFLFMVSATHPLCPAEEMDRALERLFQSDAKNLASVVERMEEGKEFFNPEGEVILIPKETGPLYGQCGAFALWSRHPTYYLPQALYQSLFGAVPHSLPYVLCPEHGLDIDTPFDLKLCENWLMRGDLIRVLAPADIDTLWDTPSMHKSLQNSSLGAVMWIEEYPEEYVFGSKPVLFHTLDAILDSGCFGMVVLAGTTAVSEALAKKSGMPLCRKQPFNRNGRLNLDAQSELWRILGPNIKDTVLINGHAPLLDAALIRKFIEHYERMGQKGCRSVSEPKTNPYWLKYIKNDQIYNVLEKNIGFRQELPQIEYVDEVLTAYGAGRGERFESLFHIPQDKAVIVRGRLDLIRAVTIAQEKEASQERLTIPP
ncbi:MAG: NTP transferase domain-containing protein [Deltaproteobacteria bacterium]|nr:NTP transferase domain-containing protein [Deltaproteobacteria bacterium]